MNQRNGFTLLELMIVIAVLAVIASITLPSLLAARVNANESAALTEMRTIIHAQIAFHNDHMAYANFTNLASGGSRNVPYLDQEWSDPAERGGYTYTMTQFDANTWVCQAEPTAPGTTGLRYFRVDESGTVRFSFDGPPDPNSPAI